MMVANDSMFKVQRVVSFELRPSRQEIFETHCAMVLCLYIS